mgnify:CR=1 FL=1
MRSRSQVVPWCLSMSVPWCLSMSSRGHASVPWCLSMSSRRRAAPLCLSISAHECVTGVGLSTSPGRSGGRFRQRSANEEIRQCEGV